MNNVTPPELLTVESLRKYLNDMEQDWTEEDVKYMGEFKRQHINCVYQAGGVGLSKIIYHGGMDFIIMENNYVDK